MVLTENERKEFIEIGQLMKKQIRTMMFEKDFNELMRQYMKLYVGLHVEDEEIYQRQKEKLNDERLFRVNGYLIATANDEENIELIKEINKNEEIARQYEEEGAKVMKKERILKSIVDDEVEGLVKRKDENVTKGLADIDDKIHFIDSRNHNGLVTQDFKIKRFRKMLGTEYAKHLA